MKTFGLIGGVASGKSTVAKILQNLGAKLIDADQLGHQVLCLPEVIEKLVQRWGQKILTLNSTKKIPEINRNEVAKIVFGRDDQSSEQLKWLESVTHPIIGQMMEQQIAQWKSQGETQVALLDAPILLKAGWDRFCDEILFVECAEETRFQRAAARGWTREQWKDRELRQTSLAVKKSKATFCIDNNLPLVDVEEQIKAFWAEKTS